MDIPQVQVSGSGSQNAQNPNQSNQNAENTQNTQNTASTDVDMNEAQAAVNQSQAEQGQDIALPDAQPTEPEPEPLKEPPTPAKKNPGLRFLDYLTSPIVELIVGQGENKTVLTAHQSLLLESPLLAEKVEAFNGSPRRIELPEEDVEAFGCFLQFQYTRDYASIQTEPSDADAVGEIDDSGEQLLKHARVYTLAEKLGMPVLKTLAHEKIHRINSTSRGEIAYARYVYTNTPAEDTTIRRPVASFWAQRSHVLRHEADQDFKQLCIEVPEFAWDVLTLVLDWKEKRAQDRAETESGAKGSARKRLRSGL